MPIDNVKIVKFAAIIFVGGILVATAVGLFISWWNTGIIQVTTQDGVTVKNIRYCQASCETSKESRLQVRKGEYFLQAALSDDTNYTTTITVNGQMKTTEVHTASQLHNLSLLGNATEKNILPVANSYLTYSPGKALKAGDTSLGFPLSTLVTAQYVDDHRLVLVGLLDESVGQPIFLYDTRSKQATQISNNTGVLLSNFSAGSDGVYVMNMGGSTASITKIADTVERTALPSSIKYTLDGSGYPVFSVSNRLLAIASSETTEKTGNSIVNPVINIYSLKDFSKISTIKPRKEGGLYALSLSPDGSNLAVLVDEGYSSVYSTKDGSEVFRMSSGGAIAWQNNESFVYVPTADSDGKVYNGGGLLLVNLNNHSSSSIIDSSLLRSISISALLNNKLYITGYPNNTANQNISRPNGYVINLGESASEYISPSKEPLVKKLPYRSLTYDIWYSTNSGSLALHTNAYTGYRNLAARTIHELGFDPGNYNLHFENYVNPFQESTQ